MSLKEAADGRHGVSTQLATARGELQAAQARIRELEGERDEIRSLLERFLAENWKDLKENPDPPAMPADLARLLERADREEVAGTAQGSDSEHGGAVAAPAPPTSAPAAGRPRFEPPASPEELRVVLQSGARIETTESFHRFQPVKTSHIKVSDWLARAHDYGTLQSLARDQVSDEDLLSVVHLFFQKAFVRIEPG